MVLVPRRLSFRLLPLVDCKAEVEYIWKQAIKPHCSPFFTRFSNNSWVSWMNNIHDDYTIASGWKILNYISCGPECECRKKTSQEFLTLLHCWKFALRSVWAKINHLCKHSPNKSCICSFLPAACCSCVCRTFYLHSPFFLYFSCHSTAHKTLISKTICCMGYHDSVFNTDLFLFNCFINRKKMHKHIVTIHRLCIHYISVFFTVWHCITYEGFVFMLLWNRVSYFECHSFVFSTKASCKCVSKQQNDLIQSNKMPFFYLFIQGIWSTQSLWIIKEFCKRFFLVLI